VIILGKFWGIVSVFCLAICFLKIVIKWFNRRFVIGLSRKNSKRLIEVTFAISKIIEELHGVIAIVAFLSSVIHMIIMNATIKFSYLGTVCILIFICIILLGIIDKYIYKDKSGDIKMCHIIMSGILFIFLFLHCIIT